MSTARVESSPAPVRRRMIHDRSPLDPGNPRPPLARTLVLCAVLAAVYLLTGSLGLQLATLHRSASLVWPPSGLALAALLVLGK
ncbi:MAG: hypothetical protein EHM91_07450, partial [Planctomycetota bacterium]